MFADSEGLINSIQFTRREKIKKKWIGRKGNLLGPAKFALDLSRLFPYVTCMEEMKRANW
jgi:hypothetical protein